MHKHAEYPEVVIAEAYNDWYLNWWKTNDTSPPEYDWWEKENATFIKSTYATAKKLNDKKYARQAVIEEPERAPRGSRKEQAIALYKETGDNRMMFINRAVKELNMSKAGAQTYFYQCKKS